MKTDLLRLSRRSLLGSAAGGLASLGLSPSLARASVPGRDLKFIFVFANGGWDPTRVFAPEFRNPNVAMEPGAELSTIGGITYVDHPERPSVRQFFENHYQSCLVVNGVQIRSIAHEICTMIALTGDTSGFKPHFGTIIANSTADAYTLPHLVLDGPSFTGALGTAVARSGASGQLEGLLSGSIVEASDLTTVALPRTVTNAVDNYLNRRIPARALRGRSAGDIALAQDFLRSHENAVGLKDYRYVMDFSTDGSLEGQAQVAVDALTFGVSRCVSLSWPGASGGLSWDTHADNDAGQSPLWESLFAGLSQLMALLRAAPGHAGASLAEETVVVVQSEMGRTPNLNPTQGKDHWPYTSVLLLGPGLTTDRVIGGFDDTYVGELVDPISGEVAESGHVLSMESLGAGLLALADIDPAEHVAGAETLEGILG